MRFAVFRRLYRVSLWLLPGEFRRRHGAELERVFEQHLSEGYARSGWVGVATVWVRCIAEVLADRLVGTMQRLGYSRTRSAPAKGTPRQIRAPKAGKGDNMKNLLHDLGVTFRTLSRTPGFASVAVLTLALGIGANTAIFTLLDTVILSPLPFPEADRLIAVSHRGAGPGREDMGQTAAWHFTYQDENRSFEDLGMYGLGPLPVTGAGEPEAVPALFVTSGVFRALRVNPVIGRTFTNDDEGLDAPSLILLSHGYWQTRFGKDPGVIGQTLRVNGVASEIIGVMPSSIRSLGYDPAIIVLLQIDRSQLFVGNTGWDAVARLRDGVSIEQAAADIARMLPMAFEKFPGGPVIGTMREAQLAPLLQPLKDDIVGSASRLLWILMGGVGVVLLIACANVANLFLVRAEGKGVEMAVRTAMGASTTRIGWEYLKESLVLGVLGGMGGLVLAHIGIQLLVSTEFATLPRLADASLNPQALLFTLTVSLGSGLLFGLFPVLKHRRVELVSALKEGGSSGMSAREKNRTQNALAVIQMAFALVLLLASGLMLRTAQEISNVNPGFSGEDELLAFRLTPSQADVQGADNVAAAHEAIARRLAELPGVSGVAIANSMPMDGSGNVNPFYAEGVTPLDAPTGSRRHKWIGADYFETLRIPLLHGRPFFWSDIHDRMPVAIVSETLAREYWGSAEAAMGKLVAARPDPPRWYEVIGVAADVRENGMDQDPPVLVYWPQVTLAFWQGMSAEQPNTWRTMSYAVRSSRVGTADFLQAVKDAVWEVNPSLPVRNLRTFQELMTASVARTTFSIVLLGTAAGSALLLGIIGLYGVISYSVSQRTKELGMRMALGAPASAVKKMVLLQGLLLSAIGMALGLGLAFALTRLMTTLLYGVSPVDPLTFALVPTGLLIVVLLASYVPARRAAQVDPISALRQE
ncbi:MAG: ABC transporter permease [Gemmatimonadota bacterium]|nr:MAG: ABC transporter permease [Gemmatimonadota bacterium]